ncbi:hypothetical protein DL93DRAFT_1249050 [Clavulina sp. PMI_390]|nr:hypothetical protein DL93DRAFT_1249050 [Clavulina sp. PMI_390]
MTLDIVTAIGDALGRGKDQATTNIQTVLAEGETDPIRIRVLAPGHRLLDGLDHQSGDSEAVLPTVHARALPAAGTTLLRRPVTIEDEEDLARVLPLVHDPHLIGEKVAEVIVAVKTGIGEAVEVVSAARGSAQRRRRRRIRAQLLANGANMGSSMSQTCTIKKRYQAFLPLCFCLAHTSCTNKEFRAWLLEEKMVNRETLSKDQERKHFAQFVEDFNTATLPHEKYYNMAKYDARMNMVRNGELLVQDTSYDPNADLAAHTSSHKRAVVEHDSYLNKDQLLALRKVQNERIEAGKMKAMGLEVRNSMGVRMDGNEYEPGRR